MKTVKLILLGLITFLITALWLTPAAFVEPHIERLAPNVQISGSSGTIWSGKATNARVNGFDLGNVTWKIHPFKSLLSLALVSNIEIVSPQLKASGQASYGLDRGIKLDNTNFEADANLLSRVQRVAQLGGEFQGLIEHAEIYPEGFPVINGVLNFTQGEILAPVRLDPGNYRADISSENESLIAAITNVSAPLDINGKLVLQKNWQYQVDLSAKPQADMNPVAKGFLRSQGGNPGPDGTYLINRKGALQPVRLY